MESGTLNILESTRRIDISALINAGKSPVSHSAILDRNVISFWNQRQFATFIIHGRKIRELFPDR